MLQRQRRAVHARIGDILSEQHRALVDAQPWLLAHHLAEARDPEAVAWFERAGTRAAADAAFWEATRHFHRALEVAGTLGGLAPLDELRLQIGLGNAMFGAHGWGAADTLPVWSRAEELARELLAVDELTSALNGLATYWNQAGDCRRSAEIAEEILRVADAHDLRAGQLRGHCTLALNHLFLGEVPLSLQHARRAIALYRPEDFHTVTYGFGTDQGVIAYSVAGAAAWFTGRPDEGIALTGRAVQLGHTLASPISELLARIFKGLVHHLRGESELARSEAEVLSAEGARLSLQLPLGFGHILGGALRAIETADPQGVADIEAGMNELAASGGQAGAPIAFVLLAEAHLATGATETARGSGTGRPGDSRRARPALRRCRAAAPSGARCTRGGGVRRRHGRPPGCCGERGGSSGTDRAGAACGVRPRRPSAGGDGISQRSAQEDRRRPRDA